MGIPEDEVGQLNLLEYDALMKRKHANDNRERLNVGIVAAAINNCAPFGDPDREAVSPLDYVPDWKHMAEAYRAGDLTQMSPEQQRDYMLKIFGKRTVRK